MSEVLPGGVEAGREREPQETKVGKTENSRQTISRVRGSESQESQKPSDSIDRKIESAEELRSKRNEILKTIDGETDFSILIEGVGDEKIKELICLIAQEIENRLGSYGLNPKQIDNIKKGIISKILKSQKLDDLIKVIENSVAELNLIGKISFNSEYLSEIPSLIDENIGDLIKLLEQTKALANEQILTLFLSNPKAIEDYKEGQGISKILKLSPEDLKDYNIDFFQRINNLGDNIGKKSEKFGEMIKNAPKFAREILKTMFIAVLGFFLGDKEKAGKYVDGFFENLDNSKAVDKLKTYGKYTNQRQEIIDGEQNGKIKLLDGVNLTDLSSKELSPFFDNCRKNGINPNSDKFREKVFNEGKVKGKIETSEKTYDLKFSKIEDGIFGDDKDNPDFTKFYAKLNNENFIINETKIAEDEAQKSAAKEEADRKAKQEEAEKKAKKERENLILGLDKRLKNGAIIDIGNYTVSGKKTQSIKISKSDKQYAFELGDKIKGTNNPIKIYLSKDQLLKDTLEKFIKRELGKSEGISLNFVGEFKSIFETKGAG